ncbi:MAG: pantetheine-phosphate adenylyltransferase [Alphaproteobacteria bacterium]|nr:pantetheine-phosphate adenylyltransferase [Alphaproteobacteria bacterium]
MGENDGTVPPRRRIGVYPGTFDPVTSGHVDIIRRASRLVDHLVVGVAQNIGKNPLLSLDERCALLQAEVDEINRRNQKSAGGASALIEVKPFGSLLVHFAAEFGAQVIFRGLRAVSDFEFEFQMAMMNATLNDKIETVFLMAGNGEHFVSSRFVKEIGMLGGDISRFVSPQVAKKLAIAFAHMKD